MALQAIKIVARLMIPVDLIARVPCPVVATSSMSPPLPRLGRWIRTPKTVPPGFMQLRRPFSGPCPPEPRLPVPRVAPLLRSSRDEVSVSPASHLR